MGNAVSANFDVGPEPVATGGTQFIWKIYSGTKKSSKEEVSIFLCNKKDVEKNYDKTKKTQGPKPSVELYKMLRNEATHLTKLHHPYILRMVQSPILETRNEIAMITEPVFASLANLLGNHSGIPNVSPKLKEFTLSETEIRYGLSQIAEAIAFLHNDAKVLHLNISPENIYITKKGDWKLGGFSFAFNSNPQDNTATVNAVEIPNFQKPDALRLPILYPSLDYSDPQFVLNNKPSFSSDIFSLGCIMYQMFGDKSTLLIRANDTMRNYTAQAEAIKSNPLSQFPQDISETLQRMIAENSADRVDAIQLLACAAFADPRVRALRYLNSMMDKDTVKKAQFLRDLPNVLPEIPDRLLRLKVLPPLLTELKDTRIVVFVLPSVLFISQKLNQKEFSKFVLPALGQVFNYVQPPKIPLILLENLTFLLSKTPPNDTKTYIIPFLERCLKSPFGDIQVEALKRIAAGVLEQTINYVQFKQILLPLAQQLAMTTPHTAVRVNAVVCLGKVVPVLDRDAVLDNVIPALEHCIKADRSAPLLMSVVGVYHLISKQFNSSFICQKILPAIMPIATEKSLDREQFDKYMGAIKNMLQLIETERYKEYEEASKLEQEQQLVPGGNVEESVDGLGKTSADYQDDFTVQFEQAQQQQQQQQQQQAYPSPVPLTAANNTPFEQPKVAVAANNAPVKPQPAAASGGLKLTHNTPAPSSSGNGWEIIEEIKADSKGLDDFYGEPAAPVSKPSAAKPAANKASNNMFDDPFASLAKQSAADVKQHQQATKSAPRQQPAQAKPLPQPAKVQPQAQPQIQLPSPQPQQKASFFDEEDEPISPVAPIDLGGFTTEAPKPNAGTAGFDSFMSKFMPTTAATTTTTTTSAFDDDNDFMGGGGSSSRAGAFDSRPTAFDNDPFTAKMSAAASAKPAQRPTPFDNDPFTAKISAAAATSTTSTTSTTTSFGASSSDPFASSFSSSRPTSSAFDFGPSTTSASSTFASDSYGDFGGFGSSTSTTATTTSWNDTKFDAFSTSSPFDLDKKKTDTTSDFESRLNLFMNK